MTASTVAPQPGEVGTAAEFLSQMRRLHAWSGLSLPELETRLLAVGILVPGGLGGLLGGDVLPRPELVAAFVTACGCTDEAREAWIRARERVGTEPATQHEPAAQYEPAAQHERAEPSDTQPRLPVNAGRRGHRRAVPRPGGRRSASLLVATPALITIAVVAVSLYAAAGNDPERKAGTTKAAGPPAIPPPKDGWYVTNPMVTAQSEMDDCLSMLPDDSYEPNVGQDRCAPEDPLQRVRLQPFGGGTTVIQAFNMWDKIWCATLAAREPGARILLRPCVSGDPLQSFTLSATGSTAHGRQIYRLQASSTRQNGMCVGVKVDHPATAHTVHTNCGQAGVVGYIFTPVKTPTSSSNPS
ncbi:hypothetical protein [Actinomadura sp. 6N118]|uniref:hypothetical protein n=1 Tax=Actinomadura sp. 6N118 TaxID=3375151 RepID=UPI00379AA42B